MSHSQHDCNGDPLPYSAKWNNDIKQSIAGDHQTDESNNYDCGLPLLMCYLEYCKRNLRY